MRRYAELSVNLLVALAFASMVGAAAQLPWGHPTATVRLPAPCDLASHAGQITTWNSSDKNGSITNTNYTASYSVVSSIVSIRATPKSPGRHTGKWYIAAHVDIGDASTGWVFGPANGSMLLTHYPGGQDANSMGAYGANNCVTQSVPPQNWAGPVFLVWSVMAMDFDINKGWCGTADSSCVVSSSWSGPTIANGNPATNTNGMDISALNDGVSVMPAWGGFLSSAGTMQVSLYTNTPMTGATIAGFKYWDQP